jgi:cob(I)alamin adenosyltransferase
MSGIDDVNVRHTAKMKRIKVARDKIQSTKTREGGLLIVHTGNGKGKSTAAFGMVARCLGWDMKVGVVQFIKGTWDTGEKAFFSRFPDRCIYKAMGEGFTWETQDRERDIAAARAGWDMALALMQDTSIQFLLLDELNIVLRYGYLRVEEVVEALDGRRKDLHVAVTGRHAKPELVALADLVTEMTLVKHPYDQGMKAQRGVDF